MSTKKITDTLTIQGQGWANLPSQEGWREKYFRGCSPVRTPWFTPNPAQLSWSLGCFHVNSIQTYTAQLYFVIIYSEEWKQYWLNLLKHKPSTVLFTLSAWILNITLHSQPCNVEATKLCVQTNSLYTLKIKSFTKIQGFYSSVILHCIFSRQKISNHERKQ